MAPRPRQARLAPAPPLRLLCGALAVAGAAADARVEAAARRLGEELRRRLSTEDIGDGGRAPGRARQV